ncbi:MAG: kdsD, partial [Rhizobiaceae bacterium]|nr:kdsD [Rhizobiaceae bacterium]
YLAGIVTDGDLARNLDRNLAETSVDDIMTRRPRTVTPQMLASGALALLNEHDVSALVVVDDSRPVGIVHFHDLLRLGVA